MRPRAWILAAWCLASKVNAQDWLVGEYEVVVPDHPVPGRFVLVISRDADGRYRDEVFTESVEAPTGRILRQPVPLSRGPDAGVRAMSANELASPDGPDLVAANVRCAIVEGMVLCLVPDGAGVEFGGQTLRPGYFGTGMHVGLIEVRKRPSGATAQAAPTDRREGP